MIVVIFEAKLADSQNDAYGVNSAAMREAIQGHDGFLGIARYDSPTDGGRFISVSYWRDEASVETWRQNMRHRQTQMAARSGIFSEYRIVVADVIRDYGLKERKYAPSR